MSKNALFKHSPKDAWLILLSVLNVLLIVGGALYFSEINIVLFVAIAAYLNNHNYQCIAHNFIHNEFFHSKALNTIFSIIGSVSLWMPITFLRHHHLDHHRGNNDFKNTVTQSTKDPASLFRHGKADKEPEGLLSYSFIAPLRISFTELWSKAVAAGQSKLAIAESIAFVGFFILIAWIDWRFAFYVFIPIIYLGNVFSHLQNYCEHYGGDPRHRKTNAVSAYGKLYNFFWFNNGFHQEHHYKPIVHWSKISEVTKDLPAFSERQVIENGSHFGNLVNVAKNRGMHSKFPADWT